MSEQFDFYLGCASGSQIKAVRKLEAKKIMKNWLTGNNGLVGTEHKHFVDSGGAPDTFKKGVLSKNGEYPWQPRKYMQYIEGLKNRVSQILWSTWDYPCEPQVLEQHNRNVRDHQKRTVERAQQLIQTAERRGTPGTPVPVIQGWQPEDYIDCIDMYREKGLITDYMGIGSVCREGSWKQVAEIIETIREELPPRVKLHGYGIKVTALEYEKVRKALKSADSLAYSSKQRYSNLDRPLPIWEIEMDNAQSQREKVLNLVGQDLEEYQNHSSHTQRTLQEVKASQ